MITREIYSKLVVIEFHIWMSDDLWNLFLVNFDGISQTLAPHFHPSADSLLFSSLTLPQLLSSSDYNVYAFRHVSASTSSPTRPPSVSSCDSNYAFEDHGQNAFTQSNNTMSRNNVSPIECPALHTTLLDHCACVFV